MPLGKAKLGWQNLLEYYGIVQPGTYVWGLCVIVFQQLCMAQT